jgi:hypothetical protein
MSALLACLCRIKFESEVSAGGKMELVQKRYFTHKKLMWKSVLQFLTRFVDEYFVHLTVLSVYGMHI